MSEYESLLKVLLAFGIGLLIGIERGWKLRKVEEGQRVAGVRTFSLIGLLGGVIAYISLLSGPWILLVSTAGTFLFVLSVYLMSAKSSADKGATTEVAALLTYFLGVLAVLGDPKVVVALAILLLMVLGLKAPFHRTLDKLNKSEMVSFLQMVVLTLLVLPFLPNRGFGPGEVLNPFEIWLMVVLIQGISFFGHFAIRIWGQKAGTLLMGFFGGLASTTALTFTASRLVGDGKVSTSLLAASISAGNVVMFLRTLGLLAVINLGLVPVMAPPLVLGALGALLAAWFWQTRAHRKTRVFQTAGDRLLAPQTNLMPAFSFAFLLAAILVLSHYAENLFDLEGIWGLAVLSGLVDVDAITISFGKMAGLKENALAGHVFVFGILLAIISNSISKTVIAAVVGNKQFGLKVLSIFAFALGGVAIGAALFWL